MINSIKTSIINPKTSLDQFITEPAVIELGPKSIQANIETTIGPFEYLPAYKINYSEVITSALADVYAEYNQAFGALIEANKEWGTDYQYCKTGPNGSPVNHFVQIDMVGLPDDYLHTVTTMDRKKVREDLRKAIFEIENSLAIYQILEGIFSDNEQASFFGKRYRESLNALRQQHGKPIALVALTKQKYEAMREIEFGKQPGDLLTNEEVFRLSGFDTFFGPVEIVEHFRQNEGKSEYLLYVRASDPLTKLRDPSVVVDNPILANNDLRKIIKAYAITMNIDNPKWSLESPARINDTKAYLPLMSMGYPIHSDMDLGSPNLKSFLKSYDRGEDVNSEKTIVRAKPMKSSYGCYGHERGQLESSELRRRIRKNLRIRGPYIIQPEKITPIIIDEEDGERYTYIDRNFFYSDGHVFRFLGGFRLLMLTSSTEAVRGKIHNTGSTVWAEISQNEG